MPHHRTVRHSCHGHWRQSYQEWPAPPALADHVTCLWAQTVAAGAPRLRHRTVPHAAVEIHARLGDPLQLTGVHRRAIETELPPGSAVVGLRLRPGAAAALLGLPASELTDQRLPLADLWGRPAEVLADRLASVGLPYSFGPALQLLAGAMAARIAPAPAPDPLVAEAVRRLGPWQSAGPAAVAADLGISPRHLRRRCVSTVGCSARTLQRILRFQAFLALATVRPAPTRGLAELAAAAGYADQAHLSRSCTELTGTSPRTLLAETARICGPSHDHAASFAPLLATRHPVAATRTSR